MVEWCTLPLVRRIFGELAAQEFVSVQPMNLPSGLIFYLDFKYGTAQTVYTLITLMYMVILQVLVMFQVVVCMELVNSDILSMIVILQH